MARLAPEEKERWAAKRRRTEALQAEADVLRREQRQLEWAADGAHLTRAELEAGVDCRGCGRPILDDLGPWPPLLRMGDSEREEYAAAQDTFRRRHLDCRSHGWSMNGSRTAHCGFCCPPPPLSDQQISEIAALFAQTTSPDPVDLDTWQLALTCDHLIESTQHRSSARWSASTARCPTCGQTRGVVTSTKLPPDLARLAAERRRLAAERDDARRAHERHQKQADAALRRVTRLQAEHDALDLDLDSRPSGGR